VEVVVDLGRMRIRTAVEVLAAALIVVAQATDIRGDLRFGVPPSQEASLLLRQGEEVSS
jgi:hypothetical protein